MLNAAPCPCDCQEVIENRKIYISPEQTSSSDKPFHAIIKGTVCKGSENVVSINYDCEDDSDPIMQEIAKKISNGGIWAGKGVSGLGWLIPYHSGFHALIMEEYIPQFIEQNNIQSEAGEALINGEMRNYVKFWKGNEIECYYYDPDYANDDQPNIQNGYKGWYFPCECPITESQSESPCPCDCEDTTYLEQFWLTNTYNPDFIVWNIQETKIICNDSKIPLEMQELDCEEMEAAVKALQSSQSKTNGLGSLYDDTVQVCSADGTCGDITKCPPWGVVGFIGLLAGIGFISEYMTRRNIRHHHTEEEIRKHKENLKHKKHKK